MNDDSANSDTIETLRNRLKSLQSVQTFRVNPVKSTATVEVSLDDSVNERTLIKQVVIIQIPVNMNDATTGHKLQGMSVDNLLVSDVMVIHGKLDICRALKSTYLEGTFPFEITPEIIAGKIRCTSRTESFRISDERV